MDLDTPNEAASRAAADAVAHRDILAILAHHHVAVPPPQELADLVSAMHAESFSRLAELSGSTFNYPHAVVLALRRAWRQHHGRLEDAPGTLDRDSVRRLCRCATFGEAASILEDECRLGDELFRGMWMALPYIQGRLKDEVADAGILDESLDHLAV
jgi:hypothetical protein